MGNVIVRRRVEHGVVWITVRVRGYLYDVAAPASEEWTLHMPGGIQHGIGALVDEQRATEAKDLVTSWARENVAELGMLFHQAKEQREGLEQRRRRTRREVQEHEGLAVEEFVGTPRDSGVRFKVSGGIDAAESKPVAGSSGRR